MAKCFKFKISKILSFKSCRSKDPSTIPHDPVPPFLRPSTVKHNRNSVDFKEKPPRSSFKRHVSSALSCGLVSSCSSTPYSPDLDHTESSPPPTPRFYFESQGNWHVIAKVQHVAETPPRREILDEALNDNVLLEKQRRKIKKKKITASSSESIDGEETESLLPSSRSLSTGEDSSTDLKPPRVARRKNKKKNARKSAKRFVSTETKRISASSSPPSPSFTASAWRRSISTSSSLSPVRLSEFMRSYLVPPCSTAAAGGVEGKVAESLAVVKRSEDPYEDFKGSMVEMIVEKEMFEGEELEQLLRCFLTLNSRHHHAAIVKAFVEIWEAMFSGASRRSSSFRSSFDCISD